MGDRSKQSIHILVCLVSIGFFILIMRLGYLQLWMHQKYSTLAEQNRIRIDPIMAPRGKIYDRHGVVLAEDRQSFQYILKKTPPPSSEQALLSTHCFPDRTSFEITAGQSIIARRLSPHELVCVSFFDPLLPSFGLESRFVRYYPFGEMTSHLLGYLGPGTPEQLAKLSSLERKARYNLGRSGIEAIYEQNLRGTPGWKQREVNAKGKTIRHIDAIDPSPGEDITLTLDMRLQKAAYDALASHVGAFVILDPRNGELLALASRPSFNANAFSYGIPHSLYQALLDHPDQPLYHRATQGLYPPASTIKPYYALAALATGTIQAEDSIQDQGWFTLEHSRHIFHDWKRSGHGRVNLPRAIAVSCDTYFYQLAVKMGIERMAEWLERFGFGTPNAQPLSQRSGLVPSPAWKKSRHQQAWTPGDTVNTGIGQGALLVTPIQQALAAATLANRGQPMALKILSTSPARPLPAISADPKDWQSVIAGMQRVVQDPEGTAHRLSQLPITLAAKTGTAQVVSLDKHKGKRRHMDHHWLIGFAPVDEPKIAFAILIEHEHVAVNVAERFFQLWLSESK